MDNNPTTASKAQSYLKDAEGGVIPFSAFKNKSHALTGMSGCGKSLSLMLLHEHLDSKDTLIIDHTYTNTLNAYCDVATTEAKELFKETHGINMPQYEKATNKLFSDEVKLSDYKNIIVEGAWFLFVQDSICEELKKLMIKDTHTIIMTFMHNADAVRAGFKTTKIKDVKTKYLNPQNEFTFNTFTLNRLEQAS